MGNLLMTGCQSTVSDKEKNKNKTATVQMSDSEKYIVDEDGCNNFLLDGIVPTVVPNENGYYFKNNLLLNYYDMSMDKTVIVCNKPDCNHTYEDNCYARIETADDAIYRYKNNIYVITVCEQR